MAGAAQLAERTIAAPTSARADVAAGRPPPALRAGERLGAAAFGEVRRRLVLGACKWDPQVGDVATLAAFPLVLRTDVWDRLAEWSESLSEEAVAAEQEVLEDARLLKRLGLPRPLRRVLARAGDGPDDRPTPAAARVMRFDFHLTARSPATDGWQISEANADVPGGFSEASAFPALMASHFPELRTAGDPGAAWADAVASAAHEAGPADTPAGSPTAALLCAAGYMEDQQVVSFLAARLRERGIEAMLVGPSHLRWRDGRAWLETGWHRGPLAVVVRFYQGEWLARLPRRAGWERLFRGGRTPVINPGSSVVIESKRFPLVWDALRTPLLTWRMLLPETRDPRDVPGRTDDDGWLLKSAFCNTGDCVCAPGWVDARRWRSAAREARWFPWNWVSQRRFDAVPLETPDGPMYPCLGVYTVNGRAAGIYGRLSRGPVVDYAAVDVAVLLAPPCHGMCRDLSAKLP